MWAEGKVPYRSMTETMGATRAPALAALRTSLPMRSPRLWVFLLRSRLRSGVVEDEEDGRGGLGGTMGILSAAAAETAPRSVAVFIAEPSRDQEEDTTRRRRTGDTGDDEAKQVSSSRRGTTTCESRDGRGRTRS